MKRYALLLATLLTSFAAPVGEINKAEVRGLQLLVVQAQTELRERVFEPGSSGIQCNGVHEFL